MDGKMALREKPYCILKFIWWESAVNKIEVEQWNKYVKEMLKERNPKDTFKIVEIDPLQINSCLQRQDMSWRKIKQRESHSFGHVT